MEIWKLSEPYIGAHLRVKYGPFYHHGIYTAENEVVQFGSAADILTNAEGIVVMKTDLLTFLSGGFLEVREFTKKERKKLMEVDKSIGIALSRIGEGKYNIIHNNCEHFVNECLFGEKISNQVNDINEQVKKMLEKK